jgi:hypothetical protein
VAHPLEHVIEFLEADKKNLARLDALVDAVIDDPYFSVILDSIEYGHKDCQLVFRKDQLLKILYPQGLPESAKQMAYKTASGMRYLALLRAREIVNNRVRSPSHVSRYYEGLPRYC